MPLDVIVPSELDGEELFRRNGEYVPKANYDRLFGAIEWALDALPYQNPLRARLRYVLEQELSD